MRRDESGFRHGLAVRMGKDGPRGKLYRCESRNGGHYWKVRLLSGEWVWPDGIILDGPGPQVDHCLECRLPFMGDVGDLLCPHCSAERFGTNEEPEGQARASWRLRRRG